MCKMWKAVCTGKSFYRFQNVLVERFENMFCNQQHLIDSCKFDALIRCCDATLKIIQNICCLRPKIYDIHSTVCVVHCYCYDERISRIWPSYTRGLFQQKQQQRTKTKWQIKEKKHGSIVYMSFEANWKCQETVSYCGTNKYAEQLCDMRI